MSPRDYAYESRQQIRLSVAAGCLGINLDSSNKTRETIVDVANNIQNLQALMSGPHRPRGFTEKEWQPPRESGDRHKRLQDINKQKQLKRVTTREVKIQFHWQNIEARTTKLVAQLVIPVGRNYETAYNSWMGGLKRRYTGKVPEGCTPLVCTDKSEIFVKGVTSSDPYSCGGDCDWRMPFVDLETGVPATS